MIKLVILIGYNLLNAFISVWELVATKELFYGDNNKNKQWYSLFEYLF